MDLANPLTSERKLDAEVVATVGPNRGGTLADTASKMPMRTDCETAVATAIKNPAEAASHNLVETLSNELTNEVSTANSGTSDAATKTPVSNKLPDSMTNDGDGRDIVFTESLADAESPTDTVSANTPTETISSAGSNDVTKHSIRRRVWRYLEEHRLSLFPRPVYNRIPNFRGALEAAQRLRALDQFCNAKTVLVNPDKPLESVRMLAVEEGKVLVVPVPRLQSGLLTKIILPRDCPKHMVRRAITRKGLGEANPIELNSDVKIDLLIIGSVAVSRNGLRIGKGRGYTDLEFAIMQHVRALNEDALIVTMVHECQIIDDMPHSLFGPHDVPIDIIITPSQTILVTDRPPRPTHIMWSLISERRLNTVTALKKLKENEEASGRNIILKEDNSDYDVPAPFSETKQRRKLRRPTRRNESETNEVDGDASEHKRQGRRMRRRRIATKTETAVPTENIETSRNLRRRRSRRTRPQIDFSLRVGNIAKTDRVRDVKSALAERGVKPFDITWRGVKGFCYLHFAVKPTEERSPGGVDSIIESLAGMRLGGDGGIDQRDSHVLTIERARPITRIETTDVTSV